MLRPGVVLDETLEDAIRQSVRQEISPRHVPDEIIQVEEIPYTLSGKKMEVPIRRILLGHPLEKAVNRGAMRNPESLSFFIRFGQQMGESGAGKAPG
jgi:acetoacetyl-CoA synthetase